MMVSLNARKEFHNITTLWYRIRLISNICKPEWEAKGVIFSLLCSLYLTFSKKSCFVWLLSLIFYKLYGIPPSNLPHTTVWKPQDCQVTVKAVASKVGLSIRSVHTIMTERLNWHKVCTQWVPHSLQPQQEACRMVHCIDHLQRYAREGNEFLARVGAGDESLLITSNQNQNDKVSSGSTHGHHHQKNPRLSTQVQERLCWPSLTKMALFWYTSYSVGQQWMPSVTRKPWPPFAKRSNQNNQARSPVGSFCFTITQGLIQPNNHGILAEIQVGGSLSLSIQSRPLPLRLCHFGPLKKALRDKRFTSDDIKQ